MRLSLIVLGSMLAGCLGGREVEEPTVQELQVPTGLAKYRNAFVEVATDDPVQYEGVLSLKLALVGRLTSLACFDSFVTGVDSRGADLGISVVILSVSGDSSTERVLLGGLAEKPKVTVEARLVDLRTTSLVGRFKVQGTQSGGAATARVTAQAFESAGVGVADYIGRHK